MMVIPKLEMDVMRPVMLRLTGLALEDQQLQSMFVTQYVEIQEE